MLFAHSISQRIKMRSIDYTGALRLAKTLAGRVLLGGILISTASGLNEVKADLVLSVEKPGVQTTSQSNVTTETFDGITPGWRTSLTSVIGTFTSPGMKIVPADQYGGVGGTGNYFAIGAESGSYTATLTLNGPQKFFGFDWEAADPYNSISFYSGTQLLATFNTSTALSTLSSAYYGNPNNTSQDSGEKFAYFDVTDTGGPGITSVVFNNPTFGTGFEIDNMSISQTNTVPSSSTIIASTAGVPEPSSLILMGVAVVLVQGFGTWRFFHSVARPKKSPVEFNN